MLHYYFNYQLFMSTSPINKKNWKSRSFLIASNNFKLGWALNSECKGVPLIPTNIW